MGVCADPGSYRWCQALSRSRSWFATNQIKQTNCNKQQQKFVKKYELTKTTKTNNTSYTREKLFNSAYCLQLLVLLFVCTLIKPTTANIPEDAVHITAILGEGVIFNCHVEFPNDHPVPYVLQWDKKVSETGSDLPIYIWYESYPEHIEEGYKGRVSRVSPDSPFGSASLNLTNIKESDQGWYECKVVFLNRDPKQHKNGTWFHLDVHAPPRFSVTPEDIIYVNLGDSIILNCQADGTPTPEILWYKDANPVDPSPTVGIFNDGTELRISTIRHEDIGEYTCIARNGEGQVSHTARVIIAGGAVIMVPPTNQTKLEGEKVAFTCEAKAMPGNVTVRWFRENILVREIATLESRLTVRKDGTLIINPVAADDSGLYLCEVTNGIGDPQSASAYLNVEYPAKVIFTPTVQYLPYKLSGVVQCHIKSNPALQYVVWTKDKRLLEPYQMKDIVVMANGSLLFTQVNDDHQGRYTCTPYNAQGTQGSSGTMEVLVRKPPAFTVEPEILYQRRVGDAVEMHCDATESEGTQRPSIKWQRQDGSEISETQRNRIKISGGNMTIENLRREDFGYYQCVISNEVATLIATAQLVIEGTQPHAPYNITGKATESSITLQWVPGYSGGSDYKQDYTIFFREQGAGDWQTITVTPSGNTEITLNSLASGTNYEFQVVGRNVLGDGIMSKVLTVRTLDLLAYFDIYFHTDSNGSIVYSPPKLKLKGPKPGPPRNLSVTEVYNGFLISWQSPLERAHIVKFYTIKYRTDAQWKTLNRGQIRPEETQYLVKNLVGGRTYYFRVLANSEKSYESSDEVKFPVPARVKHKAITAGVVGGILFFIVAIILSVCAVKICNKRKRRKQEKEFNMVACRITEARNIEMKNYHSRSRSMGSLSGGQVPLKKYKQTRVSSLTTILIAILHWIWPPDRCSNCNSIYSNTHLKENIKGRHSVSHIKRSLDGRFVLSESGSFTKLNAIGSCHDDLDEVDEPRLPDNSSQYSSSDDGGFLSRRNFITARASWRRPLVSSPSQLSLQSAADSARGLIQGLAGGLLKLGSGLRGGADTSVALHLEDARYQNIYRKNNMPIIYRNLNLQQATGQQPLHINTISSSNNADLYTPSRVSRIFSSSPAISKNGVQALHQQTLVPGELSLMTQQSPWSLTIPSHAFQQQHFSDLSSVYPSSAERSLPNTTASGGNLSRYRYFAQELPSLRTIQEETRRLSEQQQHQHQNSSFVPLQHPVSPTWRHPYYQGPHYSGGLGPYHSYRPRTRWYPRHYARLLGRTQSELMSPLPHLNLRSASAIGVLGLDASPESRSSSSGFGSKNNSNHPQGSHHSGSTSEWRLLPPYRPPPPPNSAYFGTQQLLDAPQQAQPQAQTTHATLPYYQHTNSSSSGTNYYGSSLGRPLTPPYTMSHWLDMISRLNAATENVHLPKSVDVGSVDGHYEFDPSTPTPSASTPTGGLIRDDFNLHIDTTGHHHSLPGSIFHTHASSLPPLLAGSNSFSGYSGSTQRTQRYDNIEARLQAMKEEFYAYRKRQAFNHHNAAAEFESVC